MLWIFEIELWIIFYDEVLFLGVESSDDILLDSDFIFDVLLTVSAGVDDERYLVGRVSVGFEGQFFELLDGSVGAVLDLFENVSEVD